MAVKITVNGTEHEVEGGRWLIDVLNDLGCDIPHFCYHPGLGPDGNCRMCQVEYVTERGSRLAISCNQQVVDGLNIVTTSDKVKQARAGVEEALLLNHPLDCPICDKAGECTLQNYYMEHDLKNTRQEFTRFRKVKALDIGPTMVLDQQRCVLCDRCVRFLRDWAGDEQLYIAGRGHEAFLTPFPGKPVDNPYSLNTYDLCPVGALTSKDFRFSVPPWFLKRTPSVCTSCARGCAIEVDAHKEKIYRLRPRHNPHVNDYWMCDEGRLNYKWVNQNRIKTAKVSRNGDRFDADIENATRELGTTLGISADGADRAVAIVASATCALEELYALKKLAGALPKAKLYVARHVSDGVEDHLLRRADRHPNVKGAEALGLSIIDLREGGNGPGGEVQGDVLFAVGFDYSVGEPLVSLAEGFATVVVMASCESALTEAAHLVVPSLTFAEKDALYVNFEGHVQRAQPAFENLWDRTPPWELLSRVVAATGGKAFASLSELRTALASEEAAFSGVNLNGVGLTGVRLEGQTV